MASSSESSDEDLEKFAAIAGIVESEVSKKCNESSQGISKPHNKPSLRHWQEEEDIACSTSEFITPEFRQHVAKKLSKFLDSNYTCTQEGGHLHNGLHSSLHDSSGIKLLMTSNQSLREESVKEISSLTTSKNNKRKCSSSSESDTDEDELNRLAEAAVSGHSIIQNVANGGQVECEGKVTENGSVKRKKEKKRRKEKKKRKEEKEKQQKKKHKKLKKEKHKEKT